MINFHRSSEHIDFYVRKYFDFFIFYFHKLNKPESLNELKVARAYKEREKHVVGRDPFTFATIIKDDIFQSSQFYKLGPVLYVASSTQIPPIPFIKLSLIPNRLHQHLQYAKCSHMEHC